MDKIMFLCDGNVPDCPKTNCYRSDGFCKHTSDVKHAVNFVRKSTGRYSEIVWEDGSPSMKRQKKAWYVPDTSELELLP